MLALVMQTGHWQAAHAQSFLEQLFGLGQSQPRARSRNRRAQPVPGFPFGAYFGDPRRGAGSQFRSRSARYRTVCVRMCDGYFFPINFSVPTSEFSADAQACRAQCPGQGKLFYMSSPNGTLEDAWARDGQRYEDIPNAFVYRERLVQNCACRPAPWSRSERLRHAMYSSPNGVVDAEAARRVGLTTEDLAELAEESDANGASPNAADPDLDQERVIAAERAVARQRARAARRARVRQRRRARSAPRNRGRAFNPFDAYGRVRSD